MGNLIRDAEVQFAYPCAIVNEAKFFQACPELAGNF